MVDSKKMTAFWIVAPCSFVEIYRRFRGDYCLHHQGDVQAASDKVNEDMEAGRSGLNLTGKCLRRWEDRGVLAFQSRLHRRQCYSKHKRLTAEM
jgi:hypothetical protein